MRSTTFTAKTSVDHISPKTPTDRDENQVVKALDHFENRLDSLTMDLSYGQDTWNDDKALAHQAEMLACLTAEFSATPGQGSRP